MKGFIDSFKPLLARYTSEVVLLGSALLIGAIALLLFFLQNNNAKITPVIAKNSETRTISSKQTITVDVSGAVKHPFVYTLDSHARIIDALQKAGGLTEEADVAFVRRNVNFARVIMDQEKLYIPFLSDTADGYVLETKRIIDYTQPNISATKNEASTRININVASETELDQLPGIGAVMAQTIVSGRPYTSLDDLVTNSIIKQSVYDKIKDLISVY